MIWDCYIWYRNNPKIECKYPRVEKQEDNQTKTLTRKITTFRQQGLSYRRNDEIHQIQLYQSNELAKWLTEISFHVEIINNCPEFPLPVTNSLLIAQKVS
jgi:hypothetical protein